MAVDLSDRIPLSHMGVKLDEELATAEHALGECVTGNLGCKYIYCQASGAITGDGYVCVVDDDFQAAMATNSNCVGGDRIGVPQMAVQDNYYFWLQIEGPCNLRVAASAAADVGLATTTTAGVIDDATGAGTHNIEGAFLEAANGGSEATARGHLRNAHVTTVN